MADFDVIVSGGGPAGASAAIGLADSGLNVALLDRARPASIPEDDRLDPRVVAISPGSMAWLQHIGAAKNLRQDRIAAYHRMRVCSGSQQLEFAAEQHGLDQLGWIIEIANLNDALWRLAEHHRLLEIITPAEVSRFELNGDQTLVPLADRRSISSQILIGADGARSRVRDAAGIELNIDDYNQRAIVTQLKSTKPNDGIAWQRFTEYGPLALLPLSNQRSSLVWSVPLDQAERLMGLDEDAFLDQLNQAADHHPFGQITGLDRRHSLPLVRRQSKQLHSGRIVLVGDAARSVHPLAGQGMNLGLGDAAELARCLADWDPESDPAMRLTRYARRRISESGLIAAGIHFINESRTFGSTLGPLGMNAALRVLSHSRMAREPFVRRACGLDAWSGRTQPNT